MTLIRNRRLLGALLAGTIMAGQPALAQDGPIKIGVLEVECPH